MERYFAVVLKRSPTLFEPRRTLYEVIAASNAMQNLGAHRSGHFVHRDHLKAMALTRELQRIYHNLSGGASWTPENVNQAHGGFFLFHQRYYINLILIHQQFAQFASLDPLDDLHTSNGILNTNGEAPSRLCKMTRMLCLAYSITLTRILKIHHEKRGGRRMVFQVLGHVQIAANTLLKCLIHIKDTNKQQKALGFLEDLVVILESLELLYPVASASLRSLRRSLIRQRQELSFVSSLYHSPDRLPSTDAECETIQGTHVTKPLTMNKLATPYNTETLCMYQQSPCVHTTYPMELHVPSISEDISTVLDDLATKNGKESYSSVGHFVEFLPAASQPDVVTPRGTEKGVTNVRDSSLDTYQHLSFDTYDEDNLFFAEEFLNIDAEANADDDLDLDSLLPQAFWQTSHTLGAFSLASDPTVGIHAHIDVF
ncbi:hypothetical protein H2204_000402 [Knufia peltigerae]|uniref:Uncharacterized protein n=1 Tax=Knufia peltigerae TaxID=1002370 RepID=A0AA39D278_9EURO|nr:hypothetical protein H2204_000402 [Knufia peltigerae]